MVATFVYQVVEVHMFDFDPYIKFLINFNITGPFYYIALYLQLIIISPVMYRLIKKIDQKREKIFLYIVMFIVVTGIAWFTTNHSNVRAIYGGGGKLLGGTYLILFYIGMLIEKVKLHWKNEKIKVGPILISILILCGWCTFVVRDGLHIEMYLPFGAGINPPGVSTSVLGLLVGIVVYHIVTWMETCNNFIADTIIYVGDVIGTNSLYIFLYHKLFLDRLLIPYIEISNIWFKRIVYIGIMIIGPIIIKKVYTNLRKIFS